MNLHPCSREFQDTAKNLGLTGNELIQRLKREGILKTDYQVKKEINEKFAKDKGFKSYNDYQLDSYKRNPDFYTNKIKNRYYYQNGGSPLNENPDCNNWFGYLNEKLFDTFLRELYDNVNVQWNHLVGRKNKNNINFVVRKSERPALAGSIVRGRVSDSRTDQNYRVASIARSIEKGRYWKFPINYNSHADLFILTGYSDRDDLDNFHPVKTWIFPKDAKIRKSNANNRIELWRRANLTITDIPRYSYIFNDYLLNKEYQDRLIEMWNDIYSSTV